MEEVVNMSEDEKMDTSVASVDESNNDESVTEVLASATTASGKKPSKLNASASARSASGSNLKLQAKIESAKKREEEKERKEREKREKEEQRIKREQEAKRKREEEELLRKKKAEEIRLKKEEERAKKEEEERERKRKIEEARLKKEEEKARKEEEERERKRKIEEARLKKEEEKARKEEEERERKRKLEELRLKREEEKEKLAQERFEKEKKRLEALTAKTEEKKRKEEEKQKEELLTVKTKIQFESYFIKKEGASRDEATGSIRSSRFMPFQLKENMSLAPPIRRTDCLNMNEEQRAEFLSKLDKDLKLDEEAEPSEPYKGLNYLDEIRKNPNLIRKQTHSCRRRKQSVTKGSASSDEVKIIDVTSSVSKFKVKYLHFDPKVYRRPPYYGTWRKRSKAISAKNPFGKDEKLIDYEIDSDDEWEDEADGESIENSEKGDLDQEELGDDEDDDGFFVPHGHLSDDELDEDERNLDPETKQAREDAKKEQYETERKRVSKYLIPKCFSVLNIRTDYFKPSDIEDIKHLYRLRMVPIAGLAIPVTIQTDEVLEKLAAQKAADDAAQKLANKAAKQAAHLESLSSASPTSVTKSSKNANSKSKQAAQLIQSATASPASPSHAPAPVATTPSIINFISKMSNKKVVCRLEPINGAATTTPTQPVPVPSTSTANVETSAKSLQSASGGTPGIQTPRPMTPGLRMEPDAKNRTPIISGAMGTPTSTGKLNTSCSTAEKRVSCFNNSNNEEENSGKRLKLDNESGDPEVIKAATNTPANAAIVINTLFRSASSCKKSLKLSSSAKKLSENSAQKKPVGEDTPSMKRAIVLQDSATSNSPVKMDPSGSNASEAPKVRPMQKLGDQPAKDKENDKAYITVD